MVLKQFFRRLLKGVSSSFTNHITLFLLNGNVLMLNGNTLIRENLVLRIVVFAYERSFGTGLIALTEDKKGLAEILGSHVVYCK